MRLVFNLIDQGTSPIFQAQNGLSPAADEVEIGEESRNSRRFFGYARGNFETALEP